jgi:sterol desaturase/sphingolipid hydroxylase (fatty acid hydroxylase superfamily)
MVAKIHPQTVTITVMENFITGNEAAIRLGFFFGVFGLMGIWELLAPRRSLTQSKPGRWVNNIALVVVNTIVIRAVFPTAAVGVAAYAIEQQWGLLNQLDMPMWMALVLSLVLLDGVIFLQHVMFHAVPLFWRLHRVHHADMDFDVTTGSRFHTIEILLSMLIKFAAIILLGPPLVAVVIFEVVLNATSMFNHSNVRLPLALDRLLRLLIVTPDMHRVHHSHYAHETNSNFGFNLSIWDRFLGTYRAQPDDGHDSMVIGIDTFRDSTKCIHLHWLLLMPFVGTVMSYAINSRNWTAEDES